MITFRLISLEGVKFDESVHEVLLPTLAGEIGVYAGHMPLISVAKTGVIKVRKKAGDLDDMRDIFAISGGAIEINGKVVTVLVDEATHSEELSEQEAKEAYERALELKSNAKDQLSLSRAQDLIDRSAVRLQVAGLKRRHLK